MVTQVKCPSCGSAKLTRLSGQQLGTRLLDMLLKPGTPFHTMAKGSVGNGTTGSATECQECGHLDMFTRK